MGAIFIDSYIVENCEEEFFESLGFGLCEGHLAYHVDKRPYVRKTQVGP